MLTDLIPLSFVEVKHVIIIHSYSSVYNIHIKRARCVWVCVLPCVVKLG